MSSLRPSAEASVARRPSLARRPARAVAATVLAALALAGCGGGGGGAADTAGGACSLDGQKAALRTQLQADYLWYSLLRADPPPAEATTLRAYLDGVVSSGDPANLAAFPKDRWSGLQTTEASNRFFVEGQSRGYGVSVAGLEVRTTTQPLRVRYVEPLSPAAAAGVRRGDTIVQVNGRPATELTQADDFTWLETTEVGTVLTLRLRAVDGRERTVQLTSADFTLQPVSTATVLTSPRGRKVGYLVLKDFIAQATNPLADAFGQFTAAGVQDLVVDLRYNGGGLVSLSSELASRIAQQATGQAFTTLRYNDKRAARSDFTYRYAAQAPGQSLRLSRVYVLTGQRTCSASELLVNGLKPFVEVVQIGETTCGKPVGFVPWDNGCGSTVSAVNFEAVNARNEGRYWDGLVPTARCAIAEDWNRALGDPAEVLTAAALTHVDTGACPAPTASDADRLGTLATRLREARRLGITEPGEHPGMIAR